MSSYVEISVINQAGGDSPLADPYICMVGQVDGGAAVNFSIASNGLCTANGNGQTVVQLSSLTGPLQIDSTLAIAGGRIYFSDSPNMISVNGVDPSTSEFYYDWVEFSLNGNPQQLVVNTTQVDQFGFPIQINVNPPDSSFGATAGSALDRASTIAQFKKYTGENYAACLYPNGPDDDYRILSPNLALGKTPDSPLARNFISAIDRFFQHYTDHALYLSSDRGYSYKGAVTRVQEQGSDGNMHHYNVLQFNFAKRGPINPGIPLSPPEGDGPYNIYYPFFSTNNPQGHAAFDGKPSPPPPLWWTDSGQAKGKLNRHESPARMVFACNGVFADGVYQYDTRTATPQTRVLGNLQNQVVSAFNRGYANSMFTLTGRIAPSGAANPATGLYTSVVTLGKAYADQSTPNTTANLEIGMNVMSFGDGVDLTISAVTSETTFQVSSAQNILAQNDLYLLIGELYPEGASANAYAEFFHQPTVSLNGRAYAFAYDDQDGFSSTLTSNWENTPSTLTVTLCPWQAPGAQQRTVDIITVVDASSIMQAVKAGTLAAGTQAAPTSLGSWVDSDKFIFMIADGSYVANNQGKSELQLNCQIGDKIRWSITNPSADYTYNCLLYKFTTASTGIISVTEPQTKTMRSYHSDPSNPATPVMAETLVTTWVASVENTGNVQYSWAFQIIETATGETVGYFFWDPFINVGS